MRERQESSMIIMDVVEKPKKQRKPGERASFGVKTMSLGQMCL